MSDIALTPGASPPSTERRGPNLESKPHFASIIIFVGLLVAGLLFAGFGVKSDIDAAGAQPVAIGVFILLGVALLIALGFEFINGFHDTANAVATVIYTHTLPAQVAVIWSGCWNLIGVLTSSGAVAFTVVSLLPVELILQVGSASGFDMIFALLVAAIIWNLGTWSFGLPASSSHTLIGSIIGVGLANQFLAGANSASGVDWGQAWGVFRALLVSPIVGFIGSALLLVLLKTVVRIPKLYAEPDTGHPPPLWIRGLLVLTCTFVSFGHGSNDGQKGMGLIMLILIGTVPTAYAVNRAMSDDRTPAFLEAMQAGETVFAAHANGATMPSDQARPTVEHALETRQINDPKVFAALSTLTNEISAQVREHGAVKRVPAAAVKNVRNDMFMASEAVRRLGKAGLSADDQHRLASFKGQLDQGTKYIPTWVKVVVAIALGLGTMVGWKRIVVTVGEKIGKTHLSYGQGAAAEIVAAVTILAADRYGLPVSTTHVLSSGVAGTMAANGSGLQWSTLRNIALAWVLTLPAAAILSGLLFALFRAII